MMYADQDADYDSWDFIAGNLDFSIAVNRREHLLDLWNLNGKSLKIAMKDRQTGAWTQWKDILEL